MIFLCVHARGLYCSINNVLSIADLLILFQVEEKMRVDHERKSKKMKHMDVRGSESHKVEAARTLVRSLSTKIKVAIQVVDKISMRINRLRDEELWPQLHDFIQGYLYSNAIFAYLLDISFYLIVTNLCLLLSYLYIYLAAKWLGTDIISKYKYILF